MENQLHLKYKPVQLILPVDYEHIIDSCDPVVSFKEVVGGLNLNQYIKTSRKGRHQYKSETMLHLILFGFMENIRSLRGLEKACRTDVRFMYLAQGIKPSHMAFQRFIDTKLSESMDDIFTAVNQFLIEKDSINTSTIYVDGTKLEANARKFSFVWKQSVLNYQAKLYLKISKLLQSINTQFQLKIPLQESYTPQSLEPLCHYFEVQIEAQAISLVSGKGHHKHPVQKTYESLIEYRDKLKEYEHHLRICGHRNSYSKTDPDATFMHGKEDYYNKTGIFKPYYNLQIGVSDEYIVHYGLFPNPTDTKTWIPFFESYRERYGYYPKTPVADAGYGSYDNYLYNLEHGMELTMKYPMFSKENESKFKKRTYHIKNMHLEGNTLTSDDGHVYRSSHEYTDSRGLYPKVKEIYEHISWDESYKEKKIPKRISRNGIQLELESEARNLLKSERGIQLRVQRSIEVEGAFGDIKANMDYTRIQRRGNRRVKTEVGCVLIGYNLRKYHHKKHRKFH